MQTFKRPWQVGDTATPIRVLVTGEDGQARTDLASATLRLVNMQLAADHADYVVVNDLACTQPTPGEFVYYLSALEAANAAIFSCRFKITTDDAKLLITPDFRGEIRVNA